MLLRGWSCCAVSGRVLIVAVWYGHSPTQSVATQHQGVMVTLNKDDHLLDCNVIIQINSA